MLTVDDVIKAALATAVLRGRETFSAINQDTRSLREDEIYIAIVGQRLDGHDFVKDALDKCRAVIINRDMLCVRPDGVYLKDLHIANHDSHCTILSVQDTLQALKDIASYIRDRFAGDVFAIVGSNGKTTTKELTSAVISCKFNTLKTEGNYNNLIGMPLSLSKITPQTQAMVLELGANMQGEINALCQICKPTVAVFTNIGKEHLEGFGSFEAVIEAELEILPFVNTVIYNADDEVLRLEIPKRFRGKLFSYGIYSDEASIRAKNIGTNGFETSFEVIYQRQVQLCSSTLQGLFNVYNCLAGISAGIIAGIDLKTACLAIQDVRPVNMRFQIKKTQDSLFLIDVYNANPSSMKEAIKEAVALKSQYPTHKLVAILGDMLELGRYSEDEHLEIIRLLNEHGFDALLATGPHMNKASAYFKNTTVCALDSTEAGMKVESILTGKDIVLIKGSRGLKMEKVVDAITKLQGCDNAL